METNNKITNRIKSFAWRLSAMAFVAVAGYVLSIGDIWQIDWKVLSNYAVLTVLGLVAGEITKYYNS